MISVCMATYNGEKFIREQLNSILAQIELTDELIISDDGSTDETIAIIESYSDNRIKLFRNNSHCYTSNFENAVKKAKGDYIFLSDQDDVWLENRVHSTMNLFQKYDFVLCNASVVDEKLNIISKSRNQEYRIKNGFIRNLAKTYYLGCCMAFKRTVLDYCLPFPSNRELCLHDAWLSLTAELNYKTYVDNNIYILYRRHNDNVSNGAVKVTNDVLKIVLIRLYLLMNLLVRKIKRDKSKFINRRINNGK